MKNEYRNFSVKEARAEIKEQEGKRYLVGKIPYESLSQDLGGFKETIKRGAFNKTLQDGADVRALVNHDDSRILGRIKNGTLQLEDREDGLYCTVELGNQSYANDLWESIQRDDVNTLSFGFRTIKDTWTKDSGRQQTRYLNEVQLLEVSFGVVFPAYEATDSQAVYRSLYNQAGLDFDLINSAIAKIQNKEELAPEEAEALKAIGGIVKSEEPAIEEEPRTGALSVLEQELSLLEMSI
jgi:HK97 family phage prohead protease